MTHVYIAHAPEDLDPLLVVHEALRQAAIPDWYRTPGVGDGLVRDRIANAAAMVVIVSAASIRSPSVRADLEAARALGVRLIPYRIDKARLTGLFKTDVAPHLRIHASDPGALDTLVETVRARYRRRCPVLAVMNLKGGVGKTTVAAQVFGAWQARTGARALLIDLDPQYNLTQVFFDMSRADASASRDKSVISLFERSRLHAADATSPAADWSSLSQTPFAPPARGDLVHELLPDDGPAGQFDLVSGQFEISKYAFATDPGALAAIRQNFLQMIDHYRSHYDLIVFDTNPNATFLTRCCLEAADRVLAPMHADVYSLRGVRLLNQVLQEQVTESRRPALSVLFNAVSRQEQSPFEADARNGVYDDAAAFPLSQALMSSALPRSGHLSVRAPDEETQPWRQLIIHVSRGGGQRAIRQSLTAIGQELDQLVTGGG